MKQNLFDYILSAAVLVLLPFYLCLSAMECFATAYELTISSYALVFCLLFVCGSAAAFCLLPGRDAKISLLITAVTLGGLVVYFYRAELVQSMKALYTAFTGLVGPPYGLEFAPWAPTIGLHATASGALILWGCLLGAITVPTLYRRDSILPVLVLDSLPLALCLVLIDTTPSLFWCLSYVACALLLMVSQYARRRSGTQGSRLVALLILPTVLLVQGLVRLVPMDGYSRTNTEQDLLQQVINSAARLAELDINDMGGLDMRIPISEVQTLNIGPRKDTTATVMKVRASGSGSLYLRGATYGVYTGDSWLMMEDSIYADQPQAQAGLTLWGVPPDAPQRRLEIETRSTQPMIFLPAYTEKLPDFGTPRQDILLRNDTDLQRYILTYRVLDGRELADWIVRGLDDYDSFVWQEYTALPADTWQAAWDLAQELGLSPESSPNEIVAAVRRCAKYDMNTAKMPQGSDFAIWFMRESDTGYCIHFASAACVMLRAMGYPARYATGYMVPAVKDEWVTVTQHNAHAWVEVYNPLFGWLVLEPTPATGVNITLHPENAIRPTVPTTAPTTGESEHIAATTAPTLPTRPQDTDLHGIGTTDIGGVSGPENVMRHPTRLLLEIPPQFWYGLLLLALLLVRRPLVRSARRYLRSGRTRDIFLRRWKADCRLAGRLHLEQKLKPLALKARFGGKPMSDEDWEALRVWELELEVAVSGLPRLKHFWLCWVLVAD